MNVEALNAVTNTIDQKRLEARMRCLATNVVQESRVAHGRGALPFTDDDAQRIDAIYLLLHVQSLESIDAQYEHFPLVPKTQTPPDPRLDKIADLLASDLVDAPIVRDVKSGPDAIAVEAPPIKKSVKQ